MQIKKIRLHTISCILCFVSIKKCSATVKFKVQKDQQWFSSKQLAFYTPTLKTPAE